MYRVGAATGRGTQGVTTFVLATRNAHKVRELRRILEGANLPIELLTLDDFPDVDEVKETGLTFEANALLKARTIADVTGVSAIADDSGLSIDVLGGMPGILSARWSGRHGDDAANLALVLDQLSDVDDPYRKAAFVCAAAAARPDGSDIVVHGEVRGNLTKVPRGTGGFGYDPIFVPDGETRTTAEMSAEEKDAISHRGKAFRLLAVQLDRI
jgi:XTP/dITP diphosphohydrolase